MAHKADRALAKALLNGSEQDFDRFFKEYYPRIYRFALTRTGGDIELSEDLAQATLLNGVRGMANYRGDASMFTWLSQICRNELHAEFRRQSRVLPTVAADDAAVMSVLERIEAGQRDDPELSAHAAQLSVLIQEIMDRLPGDYGDALEWKYVQGESVQEIARRLGLTPLAAQSLLARARTALRTALSELPSIASERLA